MNWSRDDTELSDADLEAVFKYESRETQVIRVLSRGGWEPEICSLEGDERWGRWIDHELPRVDEHDSGLVLLLAKRSGEPSLQGIQKTTTDDWPQRAEKTPHSGPGLRRADTFAPLGEKTILNGPVTRGPGASGRRSVRTLPFTQRTFRKITRSFHTHGSIARVVSRADVPVFTFDEVRMGHPAYVYNCRSSNAWEMDLALTVTHFPHQGLTFAILFGCPFNTEKEIVTRLSHVGAGAAHPLLMPGIFAELERARHVKLVDDMANKVEAKIIELDYQTTELEGPQGPEAEQRNREKRTAYLDLGYLRNALVSWNAQLEKMARHSQHLIRENNDSGAYNDHSTCWQYTAEHISTRQFSDSRIHPVRYAPLRHVSDISRPCFTSKVPGGNEKRNHENIDTYHESIEREMNAFSITRETRVIGQKITSRIMVIMDEYDDKIRDCTMRVDGMAMSTQWAQGETNVEIALATSRDSRHMRSIALVTMVFLPGTFFASMFSMTFFNWSSNSGNPVVSTYIWIYALITVLFTALTIGLWYYIVIFRPKRLAKNKDEEDNAHRIGIQWKFWSAT